MSGDLAYMDTFGGLLACQVMDAWRSNGEVWLSVKITTKRDTSYKRGDRYTASARRIVPRKNVRRRKYGTTILPYDWGKILGI